MPTLFRFVMIVAAIAALVYGAMISLVFLVHPNQTEMTVRVPLDNGAAPEEN